MRRSVFHGMLFHLNTAPVCVCVCVYGCVCQRARVVLFFYHHSCHAWRHDSGVAPHSEHVCTWLSWSLGRVHPWHTCYMHICHRCTSQHLVTLPHLMLLPSVCVSATLLKQTSCHHCSCQEKKSKSCQRPNKVNNADEPYVMCVSPWKPSRQVLKLSIIL